MLEGVEQEALTPFFLLLVILLSRVPSTLEEFAGVVANEDLDFSRAYMKLTCYIFLQMLHVPYSGMNS